MNAAPLSSSAATVPEDESHHQSIPRDGIELILLECVMGLTGAVGKYGPNSGLPDGWPLASLRVRSGVQPSLRSGGTSWCCARYNSTAARIVRSWFFTASCCPDTPALVNWGTTMAARTPRTMRTTTISARLNADLSDERARSILRE